MGSRQQLEYPRDFRVCGFIKRKLSLSYRERLAADEYTAGNAKNTDRKVGADE
jgi:hypothetical protein